MLYLKDIVNRIVDVSSNLPTTASKIIIYKGGRTFVNPVNFYDVLHPYQGDILQLKKYII